MAQRRSAGTAGRGAPRPAGSSRARTRGRSSASRPIPASRPWSTVHHHRANRPRSVRLNADHDSGARGDRGAPELRRPALLKVSPRASKSRNWSNEAHAGARRTTALPARSRPRRGGGLAQRGRRDRRCGVQGTRPAERRGEALGRLADQIGVAHAIEPGQHGIEAALLGPPARDPVDALEAGERARRRVRVGRLAVVDELHAVDGGHGLQAMGEARKTAAARRRSPPGRGRAPARRRRPRRHSASCGRPAGWRSGADRSPPRRVRPPRRTAGRRRHRRRGPAAGRPQPAACAGPPHGRAPRRARGRGRHRRRAPPSRSRAGCARSAAWHARSRPGCRAARGGPGSRSGLPPRRSAGDRSAPADTKRAPTHRCHR